MTISKGDSVFWSWKQPYGVSDVKYQVVQVSDAQSFTPSGFSSGAPTANGSFEFKFNQAGTYHYWSGYVESTGQITFQGVINVLDTFDKELPLQFSLNGHSGMLLFTFMII